MAIDITYREDYIEVRVLDDPSVREILTTVKALRDRDPRKEISDVWIFSEDSIFPMDMIRIVAESILTLCTDTMVGRRSAIVAANAFQKAAFDFVRYEASILPYEVKVFLSPDEAVGWIREQDT